MTTTRRKFLTFQEVNVLGHATQRGIFGGIFGAVEWVTKSWGQFLFFPSATFMSILNFGYETKTYIKEKNKSLGKTASLALTGASLTVEILAVTAALTGAIIAAELVPVLFFGMICANFLWNAAQTFYHGYKWLSSEKNSYARKQHRTACGAHFTASLTLAAAGTAIGFLLMAPAQHLITLGTTAVVAVKASTISVLAVNAIKTVRDFFVMRNKRKLIESIELNDTPIVPANNPTPTQELSVPLTADLKKQYGLKDNVVEKDITADLIAKVESAKGKEKEVVVHFLNEAQNSLYDARDKGWFINHQHAKRQKKLTVINWFIQLVHSGEVLFTDSIQRTSVKSFEALKPHIEALGSDVFSSLFATKINGGKMEKLYDVVEHYMKNKNNYVAEKGAENTAFRVVLH